MISVNFQVVPTLPVLFVLEEVAKQLKFSNIGYQRTYQKLERQMKAVVEASNVTKPLKYTISLPFDCFKLLFKLNIGAVQLEFALVLLGRPYIVHARELLTSVCRHEFFCLLLAKLYPVNFIYQYIVLNVNFTPIVCIRGGEYIGQRRILFNACIAILIKQNLLCVMIDQNIEGLA